MSNLISNYEISVWEDVWDGNKGKFVEHRKGIIGADQMLSQSKLFDPTFVRNVNGEKQLSFKMYTQYTDNITGKKVNNPFCDWLVNETKVKLYYENKWYDFFIKNTQENSSTHLNTYQLGDALVQELSKNGFGVTLDPELENNLGTAVELATRALEDTDWKVQSEVFVEKVEENLVYVKIPSGTVVQKIADRIDVNNGVIANPYVLPTQQEKIMALAFYSSCKNKPQRFQFILLPDYDKSVVKVDENGIIDEKDCQYYYEVKQPQKEYRQVCLSESGFEVYLPENWELHDPGTSLSTTVDTTVSNWYKGKRYGFAQQTKYVPQLERYCQLYHKKNETDIEQDAEGNPIIYYGWIDSEYNSPIFTQNIITNFEFKGSTGWTGTYTGPGVNAKTTSGAMVNPIYGRFVEKEFSSAEEELKNGIYTPETSYKPYLKVEFKESLNGNKSVLINSGPYDNRGLIKKVVPKEEWKLELTLLNTQGTTITDLSDFDITIREATYNTTSGSYELSKIWATYNGNVLTFTDDIPIDLTEEQFKKEKLRLVIQPKNNLTAPFTFYVASINMYKKVVNSAGKEIKPGTLDTEGTVINYYNFLKSTEVDHPTTSEMPIIRVEEKNINFDTYVPLYNIGAEKVRTVTIKESNYFNILQTIAETFEAWLELEIVRDDFGGIVEKIAKFKNYTGKNNYASFRYGVNLKDIQRTNQSKNLVSKLIVKQNSNDLAKDKFCTIARAGSNPTGENYIYDFQYYMKTGMLNPSDYVSTLYYAQNPYNPSSEEAGPDIEKGEEYNVQNYFNRVKSLNDKIEPIAKDLSQKTLELTKLNAEKTVQEGLRDAAVSGIEETVEDFTTLTGVAPTNISPESYVEVTCDGGDDKNNLYDIAYDNSQISDILDAYVIVMDKNVVAQTKVSAEQIGTKRSFDWKFSVPTLDTAWDNVQFTFNEFSGATISNKTSTGCNLKIKGQNSGIQIKIKSDEQEKQKFEVGYRYKLSYTLTPHADSLADFKSIGGHTVPFYAPEIWVDGKKCSTNNRVDMSPQSTVKSYNVVMYGTCYEHPTDGYRHMFIQPNKGYDSAECSFTISNIRLQRFKYKTRSSARTLYIKPHFHFKQENGSIVDKTYKIACTIPGYNVTAEANYSVSIVDGNSSTISGMLTKFVEYNRQLGLANKALDGEGEQKGLIAAIADKQTEIETIESTRKRLIELKSGLNQKFYDIYSRFIQEGTWMSEDYADDDKYYTDALSVLYNSCFPQVGYTINALALSKLPGYENFVFDLGDSTFVEDPDFFGMAGREEVVITEISEYLDDASKNTLKLQNFKNQFKDLFQKITATVQQTQYSTGAYNKAAELANANSKIKSKFLTDALSNIGDQLSLAGQTTVVQDASGITLTDSDTKNQMRLIGGAILMSQEDPETGIRSWKTGLTPEGISASLITAGTINAGEISIMNGNDITFRWDAFGISAYDVEWGGGEISGIPDQTKFVRFDKHGLYGIDTTAGDAKQGVTWKPSSIEDIDQKATFALTWEGLKVTGNEGVVARIGKQGNKIINITRTEIKNNQTTTTEVFSVDVDGNLTIAAELSAETGNIAGWIIDKNVLKHYGNNTGDDKQVNMMISTGTTSGKYTVGNRTSNTWRLYFGGNNNGTGNFGVEADGSLYATGANISGTITANRGTIGNWNMGDIAAGWGVGINSTYTYPNSFYSKAVRSSDGKYDYIVFLRNPDTIGADVLTIRRKIVATGEVEGLFHLASDGKLTARDVDLYGKIEATSGQIADWQITSGNLTGYSDKITTSGKTIRYRAGIRNPSRLESVFFIAKDTLDSNGATISTDWPFHVSYAGQLTATNAIVSGKITATSGSIDGTLELGEYGVIKHDNSFCRWSAQGISIGSGQIGCWAVAGKGSGVADRYLQATYDIYNVQTTPKYVYLQADYLEFWNETAGTRKILWYDLIRYVNALSQQSDEKLKKDIEVFDERYEQFYNTLQPKRYKYIDGSSNRFHTGFIAQEVVAGLQQAQISTQEFAAVMLEKTPDGEYWSLRRDEFVSLNTWQIQKLKPRVTQLEEEVASLKAKIAELEAKN